jgi:hypothetical protein
MPESTRPRGLRTRVSTGIHTACRSGTNLIILSEGPWYLALTKALNVGLSKAYFKSLGLPSLFEDC